MRLRGISKRHRGHETLKPLDLDIERGEIYGLIGENGAGKSTLIRIMCGLSRPSSGSLELFGETDARAVRKNRRRTGYVPDGTASYPYMTARQNLDVRCTEWGIADASRIDAALQAAGIAHTGSKKARAFSLGMRRRLDLAAALLDEPELLILDEPTNGLDPTGIVEVRELLIRLNRDCGMTIVVSSHILSELQEMASRYIVLSGGSLIADDAAEEFDAKGGLESRYAQLVGEGSAR